MFTIAPKAAASSTIEAPKGSIPPMTPKEEPQKASPEAVDAPTIDAKASNDVKGAPPTPEQRLEALERKERAIRQEQRRLKSMKAELDAKATPAYTREQAKAEFLADPTKFGISYEEISQRWLKQPTPEEQAQSRMDNELSTIKAEQERLARSAEEARTTAYNNALKSIKRDVISLTTSNEAFELIKTMGQEDAVVSLIEETFKEEGELMTTEEAAKAVEDYLLDQALVLAKSKRVQERLTPKPVDTSVSAPTQTTKPQPTQKPLTLTNSMNAGKALSPKERAILAFQGKQAS